MRSIAAGSIVGPTSLTTSFLTGLFGCAAITIPSRPPIEVPTQSIVSAPLRATRAVSVVRYVGKT